MEAGKKRTILLTMRSHYFSPKEKCRRESKSKKSKTRGQKEGRVAFLSASRARPGMYAMEFLE